MFVYGFVFHWLDPVQRQQDRLLQGYRAGMAVGDIENAYSCLSHILHNAFWMGTGLSSFYADVVGSFDQAERYSQDWLAFLFHVSKFFIAIVSLWICITPHHLYLLLPTEP